METGEFGKGFWSGQVELDPGLLGDAKGLAENGNYDSLMVLVRQMVWLSSSAQPLCYKSRKKWIAEFLQSWGFAEKAQQKSTESK